MKRVIAIILLLVTLSFLLTGCDEVEINSLDKYKERIADHEFGFSDVEIDHPEYLLPSKTFLEDYPYLEGSFNYYDGGYGMYLFLPKDKYKPDRVLIVLKYDENVYLQAKQSTLDNIPIFEDRIYSYGPYKFYINQNFMDRFENPNSLISRCTMVCYNNENNTICFLGFTASYQLPEKYINDLENNWTSFIDDYYGEYYDFSK